MWEVWGVGKGVWDPLAQTLSVRLEQKLAGRGRGRAGRGLYGIGGGCGAFQGAQNLSVRLTVSWNTHLVFRNFGGL